MPAPAEMPELLTLQQASKILKVHPNTLRNWERAGVIPVVRVGPRRDRRFPKHGIHQFLPGAANGQAQSPTIVEQPISQATDLTQGTDIPIQTAQQETVPEVADEDLIQDPSTVLAEEATTETPHVIVNVPPKASTRTIITVIVLTIAVGVAAILFGPDLLRTREQTGEPTFAIRRNPPQTIFADDFEVYEIGELPRPVWNTIGVWKVGRENGQRFLVGEEAADNPLGIISHVYTGSSGWKDYKLKFDAKVVSGDQTIYAMTAYLDENNYYLVSISATETKVTLVKEGKEQVLGSTLHSIPTIGEWNTYTVDLHGNNIDVLVNGDRDLGVDDAALTSGKVGFAVRDAMVQIDHVQVLETQLDQAAGESP